VNDSAAPMARCSGATFLPNEVRRASSACVGFGVLALALVEEEERGVVADRARATADSRPASTCPEASIRERRRPWPRSPRRPRPRSPRIRGCRRAGSSSPRIEAGYGEGQRLLALLLLGLVVQAGGAVIDAAEPRDRASIEKEALGQRRLTGPGMGGQDDAAKVEEVGALGSHRLIRSSGGDQNVSNKGATKSRRRPAMIVLRAAQEEARRPRRGIPRTGRLDGPVWRYTPADVRTFEVVTDQAPEGRQRRQARRRLHQDGPRNQPSPRERAAVTRTATSGCASPSSVPAPRTCPLDTIKRAIEKATGGGDGAQYEEITYEGYGPGGVAILVETATDNKNRTAADVRSILVKAGGSLAVSGSVAWQFEQRGVITPRAGGRSGRAGAGRHRRRRGRRRHVRDQVEVYTKPPPSWRRVRPIARGGGVKIESAELSMIAKNTSSWTSRRRARRCAWSSCSRTSKTSSG
jgi:hypothetical protein